MISVPFDYKRAPQDKDAMIRWVSAHRGIIIRDRPVSIYLGNIRSVEFLEIDDAVAFRLKFMTV